MSKKKQVTAAELMAQLNSNQEFLERRNREEESRQKLAAEWRQAEKPLLIELRAAGFHIESAWDLVNSSDPYPDALPILLKHLQNTSYPGAVREGIARALAVQPAKFAWPVLKSLFIDEQDRRVKDGLAVALSAVADDDFINELISLVRDRQHGASRILLLSVLERSSDRQARATLMDLSAEPELSQEVHVILDRLRN